MHIGKMLIQFKFGKDSCNSVSKILILVFFYLSDENNTLWPRDLDLRVKVTTMSADLGWTKVHNLTQFGDNPLNGFLEIAILT